MDIKNKIYNIRGKQVMLDRNLAELYEVSTKRLNEQVRRNIKRFPEDFMFRLNKNEFEIWRSQIVMSKTDKKGLRYLPFVFTEQGVSMLSGILKSEKKINIDVKK